jgi:hypothetical protein
MLILCAALSMAAPPAELPSELHQSWSAGEQAGAQRARLDVRRYRAGAAGALAGGAAAGAGLALGGAPRVDSPGCAALGGGSVGLASALWAWDLAKVEPVSGDLSEAEQGWDPAAYQGGFEQAYNQELLTQRRKWSLLAGGVSVLAVSGAWWLGSRALALGG